MNINPMELIQMIKSGQNPQQLMMKVLEQKAMENPMYANLLSLAKNNKTEEIEQIARNVMQERGLDFDKEFISFKNKLGL